jgi:tRNA A37 threonylcarbamoyladenosine dehydratase
MAPITLTPISLRISEDMMQELHGHLFPGDGEEHGAVLAASVVQTSRGIRLLAHRLFLAEEGVDYLPGTIGHRMLTADFVMDCVLECADLEMAYLAIHCHGGSNHVGFSPTDMESHERGYPALRDIVDGPPVGGLVFAKNAVAGDIWLANGERHELDVLVVPGVNVQELRAEPETPPPASDERYDRQARLFGDRGQRLLARHKVGVIGAGGAGSLIIQQLAHLGVGELVIIDPDRIEASNLSRVVGSRPSDIRWVGNSLLARAARRLGWQATFKVDIARRLVREVAGDASTLTTYARSVIEPTPVDALIDCDYIFLAADSMQARLLFNAVVHQYLIPGSQMGVKAQVDAETGDLLDLFAVNRPVIPGRGCLWCNGLIPADKLQEEATNPEQLRRQRYVDDDDIPAPSVITMNSVAASLATNGFLMSVTNLLETPELTWIRYNPRDGEFIEEMPRRSPDCLQCSQLGRLARGATTRLPIALHDS